MLQVHLGIIPRYVSVKTIREPVTYLHHKAMVNALSPLVSTSKCSCKIKKKKGKMDQIKMLVSTVHWIKRVV
jgi:hypothetical protein